MPDRVRDLARRLSATERRRAERLVFERDRRRYAVARGLLREQLASRLGVAPDEVELDSGPFGKPGIPQSDLRFNVARSGEAAVFAFSRGREIGIDVEVVRDVPEAGVIAARFFSRRENEAFLALSPRDKPLGFFNCWTRKEAFLKARGEGLRHRLDRCEVSLAPGEPARIVRVGEMPGDACGWTLQELSLGPGLVGAVVAQDFEASAS
jgi:4'-phosphopantetheinyl transferase